jgi:radical SAM protein with 4Fe4S-binding SPASM domain
MTREFKASGAEGAVPAAVWERNSLAIGPAGDRTGVLSRYNFRSKAINHLPVLEANLKRVTYGPVSVVVHPTNACNAECPMCRYAGLRQEAETIPLTVLKAALNDLALLGVRSIVISGGGEPLVYPHLDEVIDEAASLDLRIGVVTNFIAANDRIITSIANHVDWIRISINAASPAVYDVVQGVQSDVWPKLLQKIDRLAQEKTRKGSKLTIGAGFIVQKGNYRDVGDFLDLCQQLALDYAIYRPVQKSSPTASLAADSLGLTATQLHELDLIVNRRLPKLDSGETIPNNLEKILDLFLQLEAAKHYPRCLSTYVESAIGADGHVYPCCQHVGNSILACGDLQKKSFPEIWLDDQYQRVREKIDPQRCPPCRYNCYNLVFNRFVEGWRPTREEIDLSAQTPDGDFL